MPRTFFEECPRCPRVCEIERFKFSWQREEPMGRGWRSPQPEGRDPVPHNKLLHGTVFIRNVDSRIYGDFTIRPSRLHCYLFGYRFPIIRSGKKRSVKRLTLLGWVMLISRTVQNRNHSLIDDNRPCPLKRPPR